MIIPFPSQTPLIGGLLKHLLEPYGYQQYVRELAKQDAKKWAERANRKEKPYVVLRFNGNKLDASTGVEVDTVPEYHRKRPHHCLGENNKHHAMSYGADETMTYGPSNFKPTSNSGKMPPTRPTRPDSRPTKKMLPSTANSIPPSITKPIEYGSTESFVKPVKNRPNFKDISETSVQTFSNPTVKPLEKDQLKFSPLPKPPRRISNDRERS